MYRRQVSSCKHSVIKSIRETWASYIPSLSFSFCVKKMQLMICNLTSQDWNEFVYATYFLHRRKPLSLLVRLLIVRRNRLKSVCKGMLSMQQEKWGPQRPSEVECWEDGGRECDERLEHCGEHLCQPEDLAVRQRWKALAERNCCIMSERLLLQQKWTFPLHPFSSMYSKGAIMPQCLPMNWGV